MLSTHVCRIQDGRQKRMLFLGGPVDSAFAGDAARPPQAEAGRLGKSVDSVPSVRRTFILGPIGPPGVYLYRRTCSTKEKQADADAINKAKD
jgi:hypothetical protein